MVGRREGILWVNINQDNDGKEGPWVCLRVCCEVYISLLTDDDRLHEPLSLCLDSQGKPESLRRIFLFLEN